MEMHMANPFARRYNGTDFHDLFDSNIKGGTFMSARIRIRHAALVAMIMAVMIGGLACTKNEEVTTGSNEPTATQTKASETQSSSPIVDEVKVIEGNMDELLYVVTIPKGYDKDESKAWPLVVMLNGYGTDYSSIKNNLVAKAAVKQELPLITLSPYREKGWDAPGTEVIRLINEVSQKYRVDSSRIYLTGFSYGGIGTWNLAGAYPEKFAAIAPIAAGRVSSTYTLRLVNMPIWAFHNEGDDSMPLADHQSAIDAVTKAGNKDVTFTIYPQRGHDSWTQTYSNPEIYDWMLKHSLITP
jgi:predicted peptidase